MNNVIELINVDLYHCCQKLFFLKVIVVGSQTQTHAGQMKTQREKFVELLN